MLRASCSSEKLSTCHDGGLHAVALRLAARLSILPRAKAGHIAQLSSAQAGGHVRCTGQQIVAILTRELVKSTVALIQELLLSSHATFEGAHDRCSIESPADLDLRAMLRPGGRPGALPPGALLGDRDAQGLQEAKRWRVVVVMTVSVAMTTTVVKKPRHSLLRMLVDEEHGVHGHTHHSAHLVELVGRARRGEGLRQLDFQVAHPRDEGILCLRC